MSFNGHGMSRRRRPRWTGTEFADFYRHRAQGLLVFFVRRTFDVETARDLTAETFAQAFEHRNRFRGTSDEQATGWLYGIARHQLSRYARKGVVEREAIERLGVQLPTVSHDDYQRVVELAGLSRMRDHVALAFSTLSDDQRLALQLRVIDEQPYSTVARSLGVSEQTARARVSRALSRLADTLEMALPTEVTS